MTSTGIDSPRSSDERTSDNTVDLNRQIIEDTKVFNATSPVFGDAGSSGSAEGSASGNYLSKSGDIRLGPMGNDFRITEIIDGAIDVSFASTNYTPHVILNGEGGLADVLEVITPGSTPFFNQELILQAFTDGITVRENLALQGHILTPGSADFILSTGDQVGLTFSILVSAWIVNWFSSNLGSGGGGVSFPIRPPVTDFGTIGNITQIMDLNTTGGHTFKATLTGDIEVAFDNPPAAGIQQEWEVEITQDGTGGWVIIWPAALVTTPTLPTTANSVSVVVFRTNDGGVTIRVSNTVTTTAGTTTLAGLTDVNLGVLADNNLLAYDSGFGIWVNQTATNAGVAQRDLGNLITTSINQSLLFSGTGLNIGNSINPVADLFVGTVRLQTDLLITNAPSMTSLSGNTFDVNFPTGSSFNLYENSVVKHTFTASSFTTPNIITPGILTFNDSTLAPASLGQIQRNGDDVFVFTSDGLKNMADIGGGGIENSIFQGDTSITITDTGSNGNAITLIDGVQKFSIQSTRADYSQIPLFGITALTFYDTVDAENTTTLTQNQTDFTMNLPDTDIYNITFSSLPGFSVDLLKTRLYSATPNSSGANLSLFRDDPSPVTLDIPGTITFDGRNSVAAITTYGSINSIIANPADGVEQADLFFNTMESGTLISTFGIGGGSGTIRHFSSVATDTATLKLLKEDATPNTDDTIGSVDFNLRDAPNTVTYAKILGSIGNVTDFGLLELQVRADNVSLQTAIKLLGNNNSTTTYAQMNARIDSDLVFDDSVGSTDRKIYPALNSLGIVVQDNVSFTVGTAGTLAPPIVNSSMTGKALADTTFGTHDGAEGYTDIGGVLIHYVKQLNGNWGASVFTYDALV